MTKLAPPLAAVCVLALVACDSKTAATPTAPTPATTPTAPAPASGDVCSPTQTAGTGPVNDPNGPFFHRTVVGRTTDGVRVTDVQGVLDHASVPDAVRLPDGQIRVYYVNGADGAVFVAALTASSAMPIGPISLNGISRPAGVVDPDVQMVGGRVRMFFFGGFGPPSGGTPRAMCVAESDDGVAFRTIATALPFSAELWTDPSVVPLPDGRWLMAVSAGNNTVLARSSDGLSFSAGERLSYGGVPELAILDDGRVRLYVCDRGIQSYVSRDAGTTWQYEAAVISTGGLACDPSRVAGTDLFVYKTGM